MRDDEKRRVAELGSKGGREQLVGAVIGQPASAAGTTHA